MNRVGGFRNDLLEFSGRHSRFRKFEYSVFRLAEEGPEALFLFQINNESRRRVDNTGFADVGLAPSTQPALGAAPDVAAAACSSSGAKDSQSRRALSSN